MKRLLLQVLLVLALLVCAGLTSFLCLWAFVETKKSRDGHTRWYRFWERVADFCDSVRKELVPAGVDTEIRLAKDRGAL